MDGIELPAFGKSALVNVTNLNNSCLIVFLLSVHAFPHYLYYNLISYIFGLLNTRHVNCILFSFDIHKLLRAAYLRGTARKRNT